MPKMNQGYQSFFGYLATKFSLIAWFNQRFYANDQTHLGVRRYTPPLGDVYARPWNPLEHDHRQLLGGLQPLLDMKKDVMDAMKPYKTDYQAWRDILQPIRGVGNVIKGCTHLVGVPLFALIELLARSINRAIKQRSFSDVRVTVSRVGLKTASWLLDGVASLIRGAAQIVTAPFVWGVKMPFRGWITTVDGTPRIEQNEGIKRLVQDGQKTIETAQCTHQITSSVFNQYLNGVCDELHRKYKKAALREQPTDVSPEDEEHFFHAVSGVIGDCERGEAAQEKVSLALQYIGLFKANHPKQRSNHPRQRPCIRLDDGTDYYFDHLRTYEHGRDPYPNAPFM